MPTTEREHETPAPADAALQAVERPSARLATVELDELVEAALSERQRAIASAADAYLGLEIDRRYAIEALIAAGGMGLVYRCRHSVLGKKLAIKIIRSDVAQMPDGTDRFLLEAKAASAIGHEHIVDIADYGALPDGSPYLVMEYLEGIALSALLRCEPELGIARIANIACQIAKGLGAAHAAGIVHRDLKPDNVFVLDRKGEDFIKILDFGVARMAQSAKKLTQAGTIVGTPHYMSPEQALGLEVDHRGDIYALGVILYELIAGRVPFDGEHYVSVLHQHLHALPPAFSSLEPRVDIPVQLERIVVKCLAKSPGDRFATMAELAAQLAPFRAAHLDASPPMNDIAPEPPPEALPRNPVQAVAPPHVQEPGPERANSATPRPSVRPTPPKASAPVAPVPTTVLPAPVPTRVLPLPSAHFSAQHERWVTALSVVVLVVVCAVAAFRLGSSRGRLPKSPATRAPDGSHEPSVRPPVATPAVLSVAPAKPPAASAPSGSAPAAGAPSGSAPSANAPSANAPSGSAPSGSAPSANAPAASPSAGSVPAASAPSASAPAATVVSPGADTPNGAPARAPNLRPAGASGAPSTVATPTVATPTVRAEPGTSAVSERQPGQERGTINERERRAAAKRGEGGRAGNKPRAKDDFMNPWPAPR